MIKLQVVNFILELKIWHQLF